MGIVNKVEAKGIVGGSMTVEILLDQQQLNGKCGLFARCTLSAGATLTCHEHHGETETYFILSGEGVYMDNGKEVPAKADDVFFCADGGTHGITNTGETPLAFMALIIKS